MQQEEQEDNCTLEHYLRTLRKKVEHHLKNPFEVPFANYSFEELFNWKNNILQLDATSLLYGQRVDFLHSGTMQILESMIKNGEEVKSEQSGNLTATVRERMMQDGSPFEKHLQPSSKIDSQEQQQQKNLVLWREIMKKRDTLPLLMLNQLPLGQNLRLKLCQTDEKSYYESVLQDDGAFYVRIIDFGLVNTHSFQVFSSIADFVEEFNYDLISFRRQEKPRGRDSDYFQDIANFDFTLSHHYPQNAEKVDFKGQEAVDRAMDLLIDIVPQPEQTDLYEREQTLSRASNYSLFTMKTTSSLSKKPRKKAEAKKKTLRQQQLYVEFGGFYQTKREVLEISKQSEVQMFLNPRDYLLLKHIKYSYPFKRGRRGHPFPQNPHQLQHGVGQCVNTVQDAYGRIQSEINQGVGYSSVAHAPKQPEKFKQAVLPIKQMKKRIRVAIDGHQRYKLQDLKKQLRNEDPLDIFIATLHIAAEDAVILAL